MPWTNQTTSAILIDELDLNQSYRKTTKRVSLEGPKRIGYFSCYDNNNDSVFSQDISSLRYLDLPNPVSIDCLKGYDSTRKYGHVNSRDMLLLRWVLENEITMQKFPSDFICKNGLMKDMMIVMYDDNNWNLSATKIGRKIVLNKMESIEKKENIDSQTEHFNQSTYAASLQRLITKNSNHSQCSSVKENDSFFGVFHTKIGSHRILHAGWLHCVESKQELDKPFVHMKFALIGKYNGPRKFHSSHKANTWWSLATLAGVDTIIRAKCEQDFTVKKIDKLDVDNLINKDRQMIFFNSLNVVLDFIKSIVTEENKCYNFHFKGEDKKLTGYMKKGPDEKLIPPWYIDVQLSSKSL